MDSEVERLVSNAYNLAKDVLIKNKTLLYALADRLVRRDVSMSCGSDRFNDALVPYD